MKNADPTPRPTPDLPGIIAPEVGLAPHAVAAIIGLCDEGCTVPFIARYRKEATGGADDVSIQRTMERLQFHREFLERKRVILESIDRQGLLTPELRSAIEQAGSKVQLEDLYLPYKPKRRTRATIAREKGLAPLAERMWAQADRRGEPEEYARPFVNAETGVASVEEALQGARDIVAESVVETAPWRALIRDLTWKKGLIHAHAAKGKAETISKYRDYYDFREPVAHIPSHRLLAILRGEKEGFLTQRIAPDPEEAKSLLCRLALSPSGSIWAEHMRMAVEDAYDRLLLEQMATEIRAELKRRADEEAIHVFAGGLRDLLMDPPFGARPVLAVDPGLRTGCKVAVLGATGRLLDHGVVYPTEPRKDIQGTEKALDRWLASHPGIAAIAVGNGTGGRETFKVVREHIERREQVERNGGDEIEGRAGDRGEGVDRGRSIAVVLVNESGASVYSASDLAREELPDQDVTVRGAVSIGRRLQDPLAELVKVDPKSIGVGQYQHDVDQNHLQEKLDSVVVSCVNRVGVDLNTASASLLRYVSGLGPKLARAVVAHRDAVGAFSGRERLFDVAGLGKKTFEQAAGFLRVKGGHPLDDSAVHPERYVLVERMARDLGRPLASLIGDHAAVRAIDIQRYVDESVGLFTLRDILAELEKPGRDPRADFEVVDYRDDVQELKDVREGMELNGTVTNITAFGAFVDVGVHQDGLVHVSQISERFVKSPADVLHVGQKVKVRVLEVDLERRRMSLSMKGVCSVRTP